MTQYDTGYEMMWYDILYIILYDMTWYDKEPCSVTVLQLRAASPGLSQYWALLLPDEWMALEAWPCRVAGWPWCSHARSVSAVADCRHTGQPAPHWSPRWTHWSGHRPRQSRPFWGPLNQVSELVEGQEEKQNKSQKHQPPIPDN